MTGSPSWGCWQRPPCPQAVFLRGSVMRTLCRFLRATSAGKPLPRVAPEHETGAMKNRRGVPRGPGVRPAGGTSCRDPARVGPCGRRGRMRKAQRDLSAAASGGSTSACVPRKAAADGEPQRGAAGASWLALRRAPRRDGAETLGAKIVHGKGRSMDRWRVSHGSLTGPDLRDRVGLWRGGRRQSECIEDARHALLLSWRP